MKSYIYSAIVVLQSLSLSAQTFSLEKTGPELKHDPVPYSSHIITQNETSFYTINLNTKGKGYNYVLEKYSSSTLDKVYSKEVLQLHDYDYFYNQSSFIKNNKYYVLTKTHNTEKKTAEYTARIFDSNNGTELEKKILFDMPTDINTWYRHSMECIVNTDTTKVAYIFKSPGKIIYETYNLSDFKKIFTKTIEYKDGEQIKYSDYKLDLNGNMYYMCYSEFDNKKYSHTKAELICHTLTGTNISYNINFSGQSNIKLYSLDYRLSPNEQNIYLYSIVDQIRSNRSDKDFKNSGVHLIKLETNTLKEIKNNSYFFSEDVIQRLTCHKPKGLPLSSYKAYIHFTVDGNIFLEASGQWLYEERHLIVYLIDAQLELKWNRFIYRNTIDPKNKIFTTRIITDKGVNYLFLENKKFDEDKVDMNTIDICSYKEAGKPTTRLSKAVIYSLDLNGKLSKQVLYDKKDMYVQTTNETLHISKGSFFVILNDRDIEHLGLVKVQ